MTPEEQASAKVLAEHKAQISRFAQMDDTEFFSRMFKVEHIGIPGALVYLRANSLQTQLEATIKRALALNLKMQVDAEVSGQESYIPNLLNRLKRGDPIRDHEIGIEIDIVKSRQGGASTWCFGKGMRRICTIPQYPALFMAHREEAAREIWGLGKRMYDHWPVDIKAFRPNIRLANESRFVLDETESRYAIRTAGIAQDDEADRGKRFNLQHYSEYAHYRSYADALQAQAIAPPYAWIIKESTGNGKRGPFYQDVRRALTVEEAERAYENGDHETLMKWGAPKGAFKFFFSWLDDPNLSVPVFDYEEDSIRRSLTEYEDWLIRNFTEKATFSKIKWRRITIANKCQDHPTLTPEAFFAQEYPATIDEAFQSTGESVFDQSRIDQCEANTKEPILLARLHGMVQPEIVRIGASNFRAYEPPKKKHMYVIGADVAMGIEKDSSAAVIFDRHDGTMLEEVGFFMSNTIDAKDFGHVLTMLAEMYNGAYIVPEVNGPGIAVCTTIVNDNRYIRIYHRHQLDLIGASNIDRNAFRFGFHVSKQMKDMISQEAKHAFGDGRLIIRSKEILDQMRVYQLVDGKYGHPVGEHDDAVVAVCLGQFGTRHAPPIAMAQHPSTQYDPSIEGVDARLKAFTDVLLKKKRRDEKKNARKDPMNHRTEERASKRPR